MPAPPLPLPLSLSLLPHVFSHVACQLISFLGFLFLGHQWLCMESSDLVTELADRDPYDTLIPLFYLLSLGVSERWREEGRGD